MNQFFYHTLDEELRYPSSTIPTEETTLEKERLRSVEMAVVDGSDEPEAQELDTAPPSQPM